MRGYGVDGVEIEDALLDSEIDPPILIQASNFHFLPFQLSTFLLCFCPFGIVGFIVIRILGALSSFLEASIQRLNFLLDH